MTNKDATLNRKTMDATIKVIVNSPEWEITLHLHEFDESWMRYALGRGSDTEIIRL